MTLSEKDVNDALERLDAGLELVMDARSARWQQPGRRAIRFEIDRARGQALLRELSERFHTRHAAGRHVLTTEPLDADDEMAQEETVPSRLYRRWHTVGELAEMVGARDAAIRKTLERYEEELILDNMTASNGQALIIRSTVSLYEVLQHVYGAHLPVQIDESIEERTPLPSAVTLDQSTYSIREMGVAVDRTYDAACGFFRKHDDRLTLTEKVSPETGHTVKAAVVDEALVAAMEAYWDLDVTIADPVGASQKRNEQPA